MKEDRRSRAFCRIEWLSYIQWLCLRSDSISSAQSFANLSDHLMQDKRVSCAVLLTIQPQPSLCVRRQISLQSSSPRLKVPALEQYYGWWWFSFGTSSIIVGATIVNHNLIVRFQIVLDLMHIGWYASTKSKILLMIQREEKRSQVALLYCWSIKLKMCQ